MRGMLYSLEIGVYLHRKHHIKEIFVLLQVTPEKTFDLAKPVMKGVAVQKHFFRGQLGVAVAGKVDHQGVQQVRAAGLQKLTQDPGRHLLQSLGGGDAADELIGHHVVVKVQGDHVRGLAAEGQRLLGVGHGAAHLPDLGKSFADPSMDPNAGEADLDVIQDVAQIARRIILLGDLHEPEDGLLLAEQDAQRLISLHPALDEALHPEDVVLGELARVEAGALRGAVQVVPLHGVQLQADHAPGLALGDARVTELLQTLVRQSNTVEQFQQELLFFARLFLLLHDGRADGLADLQHLGAGGQEEKGKLQVLAQGQQPRRKGLGPARRHQHEAGGLLIQQPLRQLAELLRRPGRGGDDQLAAPQPVHRLQGVQAVDPTDLIAETSLPGEEAVLTGILERQQVSALHTPSLQTEHGIFFYSTILFL